MSSRIEQDYDQVVIKKKLTKKEEINKGNYEVVAKYQSGKNNQNKSEIDMRKIDNEEIKLPTATVDLRNTIQAARTKLGLNQAELAQKCGLPKEIIRDYENGKAIVKQPELDKISRALGIPLKKPKASKISNPVD